MTIKVLGACCKKSTETFENTKVAVREMGLDVEVENIGDVVEISKYGVMSTPALVINEKVVSYGKLLKTADVKKIIRMKYQNCALNEYEIYNLINIAITTAKLN
jgi:small redox-active disulfide protein 2